MKTGDIVKFKGIDCDDEQDALYRVIDVDDEDVLVEYICDLSIPPHTTAKIDELEIVEDE